MAFCLFTNAQFDLFFPCIQRAINCATDDTTLSEIWYNIAQMALSMGEIDIVFRALKLSLSYDDNNAEA
jgi:tetratricopeptide repeat protein 8